MKTEVTKSIFTYACDGYLIKSYFLSYCMFNGVYFQHKNETHY